MRKLAFAMALLFLGGGVASADTATPQSSTPNPAWIADAATIAHIRSIVANTAGTDGVFVVGDDGSIRHVQSGLVCPPKFPNVDFWHSQIFSSPLGKGMDIGCDYGRAGPNGHAISKLTIFATKAPDGLALDQAFAADRNDVVRTYPDAVSQGTAFKIEDKSGDHSNPFPEIRSEEFLITIGGQKYTSQVLVAVQNGWILEIRATFAGTSKNVEVPSGGTVNDIMPVLGDRTMLPEAFVRVARSLGK